MTVLRWKSKPRIHTSRWPGVVERSDQPLAEDGSSRLFLRDGFYEIRPERMNGSIPITRRNGPDIDHVGPSFDGSGCWIGRLQKQINGYLVYWLYPYAAHIYSWDLDEDGSLRGYRLLDPAETDRFLEADHVSTIETLVRAFLVWTEKRQSLAEFVADALETCALEESRELAWLVRRWPEFFTASTVKEAGARILQLAEQFAVACRAPARPPGLLARNSGVIDVSLASGLDGRHETGRVVALASSLRHQSDDAEFAAFASLTETAHLAKGHEPFMSADPAQSYLWEFDPHVRIPQRLTFDPRCSLRNPRIASSAYNMFFLFGHPITAPTIRRSFAEAAIPYGTLRRLVQTADIPKPIAGSVVYEARLDWKGLILIPDPYYFNSRGYAAMRASILSEFPSWEHRRTVAIWRGSTTGDGETWLTETTVFDNPRVRLCMASVSSDGMLDARIVSLVQFRSEKAAATARALLEERDLLRPFMPELEMIRYKYAIDIDGNTNAWGLLTKLLMGCCVLKISSDWKQWYYDRLVPGEHYIPVATDLSDLQEKLLWCRDNDREARAIATRGRELAAKVCGDFPAEMTAAAVRIAHPGTSHAS